MIRVLKSSGTIFQNRINPGVLLGFWGGIWQNIYVFLLLTFEQIYGIMKER